jgi:peptide-methionine (R)-S-oxide reductase
MRFAPLTATSTTSTRRHHQKRTNTTTPLKRISQKKNKTSSSFSRRSIITMSSTGGENGEKIQKSDAEWKKSLTAQQFQVLRLKGTEPARTGEYDKFYPSEGHFVCAGCGNALYSAESKFNSGCGWPAFDKCYQGAVSTNIDETFGMRRVEIVCAKCDGHLGHVFENEAFTATAERHCVNSVSVKYVEGECEKKEAKVIDGTSVTGGARNALSMLIRPALYFAIGYSALNILANSASSFMTRGAQ